MTDAYFDTNIERFEGANTFNGTGTEFAASGEDQLSKSIELIANCFYQQDVSAAVSGGIGTSRDNVTSIGCFVDSGGPVVALPAEGPVPL